MDNNKMHICFPVERPNPFACVDNLPLAMVYCPMQEFNTTYELGKALQMGTIFPELCKPFCGKRGNCGC